MPRRKSNKNSDGAKKRSKVTGNSSAGAIRIRKTLLGHTDSIGRIGWSPCGRNICAPAQDGTLRVWNAKSGKSIFEARIEKGSLHCAAWSPDGDLVATGGEDGVLRVLNASTWKSVISSRSTVGAILDIAWRPSGHFLALAGSDGLISFYDTQKKQIIGIFNVFSLVSSRQYGGREITSVSWSPDGLHLAVCSLDGLVAGFHFDLSSSEMLTVDWVSSELSGRMYDIDWSPSGDRLATALDDGTVAIWDPKTLLPLVLEGHTSPVGSVSFSHDGSLLASKSIDNSVHIWAMDSMTSVVRKDEPSSQNIEAGLAFHPSTLSLATLGDRDTSVRIWSINLQRLLALPRVEGYLRYTSAKVVILGDSNVGKSCLSMRLAEDRYPDDDEQGTTHGMRIWSLEASRLSPAIDTPRRERRDVILWDMGGQEEYRLIHQLFIRDTTVALILIDPTRGITSFDDAREWNRCMMKQFAGRRTVKLLIGAKLDQPCNLVNDRALQDLCDECGFAGYFEVSARTDRGVESLRKAIALSLDWSNLAKTSRPELFQDIRNEVESLRRDGEVVILFDELRQRLSETYSRNFDTNATRAVVDQLAAQGIISRTHLSGGEEALILQLPVIERYAGSLIVAARDNPRGIPAIEERVLGSSRVTLPGMSAKERLPLLQERIVIECIAELMIQHGICYRHDGILVFPTLFPVVSTAVGERLQHSVSLYYDFTGPVDNIYASLAARLTIGQEFGDGRLWPGRIEFDQLGQGVCGIRQVVRPGGFAHVDLYFSEECTDERRNLFTRFVEDHLRQQGIEVSEYQAVTCRGCSHQLDEDIVQANIAMGKDDVVCPYCRTQTLISEGVATIRQNDPDSDKRIYALRKKVDARTAEAAVRTKLALSTSAKSNATRHAGQPIRILHLSDLHFTQKTSPEAELQWLVQDLLKKDGLFPSIDSIEYLVVSGDMTDKGNEEGFEKARQFISLLIDRMKLSPLRCIFVPGNHDVQDLNSSYEWRDPIDGLEDGTYVNHGAIILLRNERQYGNRLKRFSDAFYHKIMSSEPYPLDKNDQGLSFLFPDTGIQFVTFNSCWQIDKFFRKRSGIYPDAVGNALARADKQVQDARASGALSLDAGVLRIAVWHHAVAGPEMIANVDFLGHLRKAGVRLGLHGDVHELRREHIGYEHSESRMHIIGAGSFGSLAAGRPESTPRLYNVLEVAPNLTSIKVHTRAQMRGHATWQGWYEWPSPHASGNRVAFFDIEFDPA